MCTCLAGLAVEEVHHFCAREISREIGGQNWSKLNIAGNHEINESYLIHENRAPTHLP